MGALVRYACGTVGCHGFITLRLMGVFFNRAARRNSILTILLDVLRATYEPPSMLGILSRQRSPAKP